MTHQQLLDLAQWLEAEADMNLQPLIGYHSGLHRMDQHARTSIIRTIDHLRMKADDIRFLARRAESAITDE